MSALRHNSRCLDELVSLAACIGHLQCSLGIQCPVLGLAPGNQIIGSLDAWPTVITIHGVVTPDNGGKTPALQFTKFCLHGIYGRHGTAGRRIPAVQKGMQINLAGPVLNGEFYHRMNMVFVAVHTAWRQ